MTTNSHCSRNQGGKLKTSTSAPWPFDGSIVPASVLRASPAASMAAHAENAPRNMNVILSVGLQRQRGAFIFIVEQGVLVHADGALPTIR